jgi:hypothetical protein
VDGAPAPSSSDFWWSACFSPLTLALTLFLSCHLGQHAMLYTFQIMSGSPRIQYATGTHFNDIHQYGAAQAVFPLGMTTDVFVLWL